MSDNTNLDDQDATKGADSADSAPMQGIGGGNKVPGGSGPGSDNPALKETLEEEAGTISTADFLLARETAEEDRLRAGHREYTAEQQDALDPSQQRRTDRQGQAWPEDSEQSPAEYLDAPRAESSYLGGSGSGETGAGTMQLEGQADALNDRDSADASKNETRSGLTSPTADPDADFYNRREYDNDEPPSDLDVLAPGMVYLPPTEEKRKHEHRDEK